MSKHPAEWITGIVGIIAAAVSVGVLDEATGAWIIAGLGLVPGVITGFVEWLRKRPSGG